MARPTQSPQASRSVSTKELRAARRAEFWVRVLRSKWLVLITFFGVLAAAYLTATLLPQPVRAEVRLYVETAGGAVSRDQVRSETLLIRSPAVARQSVERFPPGRLYPNAGSTDARAELLRRNLGVRFDRQSSTLRVGYVHPKPDTSIEVLNAVIGTYLANRARAHADQSHQPVPTDTKSDLLALEDRIIGFLRTHNIQNYGSELSSAQALFDTLTGEKLVLETRLAAAEAELTATEERQSAVPAEIELSSEDTTRDVLLKLQLEREDLRARYLEDSRAVQSITRRIDQVQAYLDRGEQAAGTVRRGPNPVHQALEVSVIRLDAEIEALQNQAEALVAKLTPIEARLRILTTLQPEWRALQNERERLSQQYHGAQAQKGGPSASQEGLAVRLLGAPELVSPGGRVDWLLVALCAGLGFVLAGLLAFYLGRRGTGLSTPRGVQVASGLPVLAVIDDA